MHAARGRPHDEGCVSKASCHKKRRRGRPRLAGRSCVYDHFVLSTPPNMARRARCLHCGWDRAAVFSRMASHIAAKHSNMTDPSVTDAGAGHGQHGVHINVHRSAASEPAPCTPERADLAASPRLSSTTATGTACTANDARCAPASEPAPCTPVQPKERCDSATSSRRNSTPTTGTGARVCMPNGVLPPTLTHVCRTQTTRVRNVRSAHCALPRVAALATTATHDPSIACVGGWLWQTMTQASVARALPTPVYVPAAPVATAAMQLDSRHTVATSASDSMSVRMAVGTVRWSQRMRGFATGTGHLGESTATVTSRRSMEEQNACRRVTSSRRSCAANCSVHCKRTACLSGTQ